VISDSGFVHTIPKASGHETDSKKKILAEVVIVRGRKRVEGGGKSWGGEKERDREAHTHTHTHSHIEREREGEREKARGQNEQSATTGNHTVMESHGTVETVHCLPLSLSSARKVLFADD
jgi:hypothetical protein